MLSFGARRFPRIAVHLVCDIICILFACTLIENALESSGRMETLRQDLNLSVASTSGLPACRHFVRS